MLTLRMLSRHAGSSRREMMSVMIAIRSAGDLAEVPDPAWPECLKLIRLAPVPPVVLPADRQAGLEVLFRLQQGRGGRRCPCRGARKRRALDPRGIRTARRAGANRSWDLALPSSWT